MYYIDRKKDTPDIEYMKAEIEKLMARGIRLSDCTSLKEHYTSLREALKLDLRNKYGIENPNSPKQITSFIQDLSNQISAESKNDILNICYDDENDKWTSNATALGTLADLGYEFAQDLLDYRHAKKYAESIESIVGAADKNGLIHPTVTLGKTNRVNYSNPGIMTIPKQLLWHMIAPFTDGNVLYSVDIKNQEPNILINMTGAKELKYALESEEGLYETMFKDCFAPVATANVLVDTFDEDRVYSIPEIKRIGTVSPAMYSASRPMNREVYYNNKKVVGIETICLGGSKGNYPNLPDTVDIELEDGSIEAVSVDWESADKKCKRANDYSLTGKLKGLDIRITKAERKEFKTSWLAISYGASIFSIKMNCKTIDGSQVYNYVTGIDAIKNYRSQIDKLARQGINTIGTIFGTKLYAGDYDGDYKKLKRMLLDLPVQGSGADVLSLLIKRFYDYTKQFGLENKLNLYYTRHDELIVEVNKSWLDEVGKDKVNAVLHDMLEHQIDDWTPFKIEVTETKAESLADEFEEEY